MVQNKISKYFKYALGEIVLVVIGILIALSINNWNEQKKLLQRENILLTELKSNLQTNIINLNSDIKEQNRDTKIINYRLTNLELNQISEYKKTINVLRDLSLEIQNYINKNQ